MTPSGQTVCLCMIVKDEAHVIARCLVSARPLVDHWIIVDTGSTDGTQDAVRAAMAGVPGELVERPWVDFGHNRSEALALARPHADYSLVIDADDAFEVPAGFAMPVFDADSYVVDIRDGAITYQRTQLFKNTLPWRYAGVLHEFPTCEGANAVGSLPLVMLRNHDGRRRRTPDTYRNDAAILTRALESESDPFFVARYTFYLAQSYRDCGRQQESLDAYLRRAELGYWQEEVFVSLCQAGHRMEALGRPPEEILAVYARASAAAPSRAEAAHAASKLCRVLGRNAQGAEIAAPALGLSPPPDGLFVEPWIYEYGLRDEFSVNAYWAGRHSESLEQTLAALASGTVPEAEHARFVANARFAFEAIGKAASAESTPSTTVSAAGAHRRASPSDVPAGPADDVRSPVCSIASLLPIGQRKLSIVDVGAASFGEKQFYQSLLDEGLGRLTSFEPDPASYAELSKSSDTRDTILCLALGDGNPHTLHLAPGGMTSIFEADPSNYNLFDLFAKPPFSPVASPRRETLSTVRLDDVASLQDIDFFKIDVQGAELMILQNGRTKLRGCSIVQVEVPFVSLYKGQPTFGDIDAELRSQGFMVHGFATIKRLPLYPYDMAGSLSGINQLIDLDMIYIRDMRVMEAVPEIVLRTTAVAADICYGSFDLTLRCLSELVRRGLFEAGEMRRYASAAAGRQRVGYIHHTPFV